MQADSSKGLAAVTRVTARGLHLLASVTLIFSLAYLLGHTMLDSSIMGNDSPLHIAYASWLDETFPSVPHWYPLQGAGISLLHGYPISAHLAVVFIHRLTGLTIIQAFRVLSFLSFPLAAVGIYLFGWTVLQNRTVGLIGGLFYLLAPVTWTWMYNWGFLSQQVGFIFLPLTLIAFDRTLEFKKEATGRGKARVWFVILAILFSVASITHMNVGSAALAGMVLYLVFSALARKGRAQTRGSQHGFKVLFQLCIVVALVVAAYALPFYMYGKVANREGLNTPSVEQIHKLPPLEFFGLAAIDQQEILTRMQFPLVVSVFAVIGGLLALRRSRLGSPDARKALLWAFGCAIAAIYVLIPKLTAVMLQISPFVAIFVGFRTLILLAMTFMPLIAAYGAWASMATIFGLGKNVTRAGQRKTVKRQAHTLIRPTLTSLGSYLVVAVSILGIGGVRSANTSFLAYGPLASGIDLRNIWDTNLTQANQELVSQISPGNWPVVSVRDEDLAIGASKDLAGVLASGNHLRIDISPHEGRFAMDVAHFAGASQVNTYGFQLNLFHAMWGYQQNVFFGRDTPVNEYGNPRTLNDLANWFGIEYVIIDPVNDPVEMYAEAGWQLFEERGEAQIWRSPNSASLASVGTRPAVLVIGKPESDAYMTIFRIANDGILPYEQALLVEGPPRVDDYSIDELSLFDAIVLYGHDYKDKQTAWDLLETYVANGGGLFVDTGWEFWIPEWEFDSAPKVLPISRATWTNYGAATDFETNAPEIAGDVDTELFKPLVWEGQPWTLSGVLPSDIKDWGMPVLSAAGNPLIVAGEYGEGRVVWSGMNLIGHARYGEPSQEEFRLFGNLIRWIARSGGEESIASPIVSRTHPDEVNLLVTAKPSDRTWLLWREAYYPNWHAYVTDAAGRREVPIFRAGPGLMLMPVETTDEQVAANLRWELPFVEKASGLASSLGALLLAALAVDGLLLGGNAFTWLKIGLLMEVPKPFLGEGSNRDWAERKQTELEELPVEAQLPTLEPGQAIAQWHGEQAAGADPMKRDVGDGQHDGAELSIEPPGGDAERALLKSWMEGSAHGDDAWAEKLITRQKARNAASTSQRPPKDQATQGS